MFHIFRGASILIKSNTRIYMPQILRFCRSMLAGATPTKDPTDTFLLDVLDKILSQLPLQFPSFMQDTSIVSESIFASSEERNFTELYWDSSTAVFTNSDNLAQTESISTYLGTESITNTTKSSLTAIKYFSSLVLSNLPVSLQAEKQGTCLKYACRLGIDHTRSVQSSPSSDVEILRTVLFRNWHVNFMPEEFDAWPEEQLETTSYYLTNFVVNYRTECGRDLLQILCDATCFEYKSTFLLKGDTRSRSWRVQYLHVTRIVYSLWVITVRRRLKFIIGLAPYRNPNQGA